MAAAAHNPTFAKKVGIPQDVAKEFNQADKAKRAAATVKALRKARQPRAGEYA
jgi:hypothetical protein